MRRILALDGGGVRGVIELAFLERIETLLRARSANPANFRLCDYFDLVGGTSTGSIIAAALATGRSVAEVRAIYERLAPRIFRRHWWRIAGLQSRFSAAEISEDLRREFPQMKLDDPRIRTLLALVMKRMDTGSPWVVSNIPTAPYWNAAPDHGTDGNRHLSLAALIRASTAAPFYFGPERIPVSSLDTGVFIDGGVTPHNNPTIALLMLATMNAYGLRWPPSQDGLLLVSIGAGAFKVTVPSKRLKWRPASGFAFTALKGLIGDCQVSNHTMLQWLGHSRMPWVLNSEIGDLAHENLAGRPLFSYQRYDIHLDRKWLKEELGFEISPKQERAIRAMDDPAIMPLLSTLATAAALKQVRPEHFGITPASNN